MCKLRVYYLACLRGWGTESQTEAVFALDLSTGHCGGNRFISKFIALEASNLMVKCGLESETFSEEATISVSNGDDVTLKYGNMTVKVRCLSCNLSGIQHLTHFLLCSSILRVI